MMQSQSLPRLLYISDVPVEATVAGSALLYRLLQNYPSEKLYITESNLIQPNPDKRLPGVTYQSFSLPVVRFQKSRFVNWHCSYLLVSIEWQLASLSQIIKTFRPDAILTVTHGFTWLAAAELAKQNQIPLHLILHDEWLAHLTVLSALKGVARKKFEEVYRQAASRLCVSPYMAEAYEQQFGVAGSVLYPSRALDAISFETPSEWITKREGYPLTFAYAGSVNSQAYANSLVTLASVLQESGDRLIIYSPLTKADIQKLGLDQPNVTAHSLIPSQELIHTLRREADVLFVPMSFEAEHRANMAMSFPSKLTDYTTIGLPLLIWGPPYCSAIRWATENPDVAETVDRQEVTALKDSVNRLKNSTEYRLQLAANALRIGDQYFSHEKGIQQFYKALFQSKSGNPRKYSTI